MVNRPLPCTEDRVDDSTCMYLIVQRYLIFDTFFLVSHVLPQSSLNSLIKLDILQYKDNHFNSKRTGGAYTLFHGNLPGDSNPQSYFMLDN